MSLDDLSFLDFEEVDDETIPHQIESNTLTSLKNTNKVPDSVTKLIRGTMSNIQSHIEYLSNYEFYSDISIKDIDEGSILNAINSFDDYNSQEYLQACVRAIIRHLKTSINKPIDIPSNIITDWFEKVDTLNWDNIKKKWKSREGIVARVNLKNPINGWSVKDFAIMKLQQPGAFKDENLLHEVVVGLILNNMRTYLPCFMHTYGGIFCGYPEESEMKVNDYSQLCKGNDLHTVVITENIPGNMSMDEFIRDTNYNIEDKVKALLMVAFSLSEANKNYGYVHGDLHSKNIMIRVESSNVEFNFVYSSGGDNYSITIETMYVPVIIDYGRSTIKYEGYVFTPIEADANNRGALKDGGMGELWCEGGIRDKTGDNCLSENLVFKGVDIPGFDFMRLIFTIEMGKLSNMNMWGIIGEGDHFISTIDKCFYGGIYDRFASGAWKGHLKGNINNYARFKMQTLSESKDLANNPMCSPYGFLGDIISDSAFDSILSSVMI